MIWIFITIAAVACISTEAAGVIVAVLGALLGSGSAVRDSLLRWGTREAVSVDVQAVGAGEEAAVDADVQGR